MQDAQACWVRCMNPGPTGEPGGPSPVNIGAGRLRNGPPKFLF